jgi:hypothetical protein
MFDVQCAVLSLSFAYVYVCEYMHGVKLGATLSLSHNMCDVGSH